MRRSRLGRSRRAAGPRRLALAFRAGSAPSRGSRRGASRRDRPRSRRGTPALLPRLISRPDADLVNIVEQIFREADSELQRITLDLVTGYADKFNPETRKSLIEIFGRV